MQRQRRGRASMSSRKKGRRGVQEGPLVQILDRQRVQQAEAHDPCAGFVNRARRVSEASFQLYQGCETEPES